MEMDIVRRMEKMEKEIVEIKGDLVEIKEGLSRVEESIEWIKTIVKVTFSLFGVIIGVMVALM